MIFLWKVHEKVKSEMNILFYSIQYQSSICENMLCFSFFLCTSMVCL